MESDKVVASLYLNQNISQSCGKKALKKKKVMQIILSRQAVPMKTAKQNLFLSKTCDLLFITRTVTF